LVFLGLRWPSVVLLLDGISGDDIAVNDPAVDDSVVNDINAAYRRSWNLLLSPASG